MKKVMAVFAVSMLLSACSKIPEFHSSEYCPRMQNGTLYLPATTYAVHRVIPPWGMNLIIPETVHFSYRDKHGKRVSRRHDYMFWLGKPKVEIDYACSN